MGLSICSLAWCMMPPALALSSSVWLALSKTVRLISNVRLGYGSSAGGGGKLANKEPQQNAAADWLVVQPIVQRRALLACCVQGM